MQHPPKKTFRKRNMRWLAAGLAAALALAAALVWLIPAIQKRNAAQNVPVEIIRPAFRTLEVRGAEELDSVQVYPSGADSYTLRMHNGRLYLELDGQLQELDNRYEQELLEVFTSIVAQETVTQDAAEVAEYLKDMGLSPAKASAVIRYQNGTEATLEVGAPVPNTTYAYYRWSGDPGIYMCDVGITEAFALTANHLLPVEQPVVHAALVEEVRLANAKGENIFAFEAGSRAWLVEPFSYPLSEGGTQQLLSAIQNFRLGTRAAVLTEENRAHYGFDTPLCTLEIEQRAGVSNQIAPDGSLMTAEVEAQSLQFVIGRAEGDYFYTCAYEGGCYLVSRFLAETLVGTDRSNLLSRNPADLGDQLIASIAISTPAGDVAVDVLRSERVLPNNELELDANGQPVYDALITINGQKGTQEQLDELVERLKKLSAEGEIPVDFVLSKDAQPRWSIVMETASGAVRHIEAFRMDVFADVLRVDGVMQHYVHADAIDVITAGLF